MPNFLSNVSTFIVTVFQPVLDFCAQVLSMRVFGFQLWHILLTLMLFSIFAGFVARNAKGSSGLARSASSVSSRSDTSRKKEYSTFVYNDIDVLYWSDLGRR